MINSQQLALTANASLLDSCGEFSYRLLEKNNLLEIAEDIICLKPLNKSQAKTLLNISPPLLLKLAELRKFVKKTNLLTPVLYLPLISSLQNSPASTISEVFSEEIKLHLNTFEKISLALDLLDEKFNQTLFLEILNNIFSQFPEKLEIYSLNPQTISYFSQKNKKCLIDFLKQYSPKITINSLDPLELKILKNSGLNISYSQLLSSEKQDKKQREKYFLDQLFEIQKVCSSNLQSWEPQFNYELDKLPLQQNAALGLEVLSKICLARLVLPQVQLIKAPVYLLGSKLSNVALQFGANHLGPVAIDENSAKNLQLPLYQRILKEIENA